MNTPNPLSPEGALQPKGNSNVRLAVVTIVAIHVVFFGSLLIVPGCKRDDAANTGAATNATNLATGTTTASNQYTMPPMNTDYYTSASNLPSSTGSVAGVADTRPATNQDAFVGTNLPVDTSFVTPPIDTGVADVATQDYKVKSGDTLSKIAAMHRVSLNALVKANEGVDPGRLRIGQTIRIPAASTARANGAGAATGNGSTGMGSAAGGQVYVVKSGDTLTKIARQHSVTVKAIRQANGLKTDRVLVDQKLKIPTSTAAATNATVPGTNPILQ